MAEATKIDVPVKEVTLMEDRARVTRRAKVELPAGVSSVRIDGLAMVVADKTLQGRVVGADDGSVVLSAKVQREHHEIQSVDEKDYNKLQRKLRDLHRQYGLLQERLDRCSSERYALDELGRRALREMAIDASWGKDEADAWERDLDSIRGQSFGLVDQRLKGQAEMRQLQEKINRLTQEIAATNLTTQEFNCWIEASVDVKTEGNVKLEFEYVVPAACWRPCHTATLVQDPEGSRVEIEAEACVWQCTGENWDDVQLYFSTQRPSLGIEPPELDEDILRVQKKPDKIEVQVRDQEIQTAGMGQTQQSQDMPGIDDGGEALNLKGAALASVPSDGFPYRVTMFTMTASAQVDLVCMPELVECAILRSEQPNEGTTPLLAGPVDLIRDSGKVGRTELSFVAPNETFKLGWGPDPEIRINRWHAEDESKAKMLSSWAEEKKKTKIRLSNIGAEPKTIKLSERIPVSEIEQVEINYHADESTDKQKPDENGIITWDIKLEPFGRASCDFAFTVRKKKSVEGI